MIFGGKVLARITGWIMKSKAAKVGGSILGGSGVLTLILFLHTSVTGDIDKVEAQGKQYTKEYVDLSLKPFTVEMKNMKTEMGEMKGMVQDIHNHLFKNQTN